MARGKPSQSWTWSMGLACLDVLGLLACGILATAIQGYTYFSSHISPEDVLIVVACVLCCLNIGGGYDPNRDMSSLRYASEHLLTMGTALVIAFAALYGIFSFNEAVKPGRSILILAIILTTPLCLLYRYRLSIRLADRMAGRPFYILGRPELATQLHRICRENPFRHPLRFIDLTTKEAPTNDPESFESSRNGANLFLRNALMQKIKNCEGLVVNVSDDELDSELSELLLAVNLHSVPVYPVDLFIETFFYKIDLAHVNLGWALDGTFIPDHHKAYGKVKSLVDGGIALILLLLMSPFMLLIALGIKLQDAGPVFFVQERIGRFQKPFRIYKFRTMTVCHDPDSPVYTGTNDPRITRFGQFLRTTRLDELPQLINVIKGQMSIIGPRAEWSKLVRGYEKQIPFYHLRHMVKPGITGWAQVNYRYGACLNDTLEKLQYDFYYIKHYSLQMDASILLKTILTMLSASGR